MTAPATKPDAVLFSMGDGKYRITVVSPAVASQASSDPNRITTLRIYHALSRSSSLTFLGDLDVPSSEPGTLVTLEFETTALGIFALSWINQGATGIDPEEGPTSSALSYVYGSPSNLQLTVRSQVACGTETESAFTVSRMLEAMRDASRTVDMYTDNWFYPKYQSKTTDGVGSGDLPLTHAIITVFGIWKIGSPQNHILVDPDSYVVYNRHIQDRNAYGALGTSYPDGYLQSPGDGTGGGIDPDDREAPCISFRSPNDVDKGMRTSWATQAHRWGMDRSPSGGFERGRQNILIKGFFGYTEANLGVPVALRLATERLALRQLVISYGDPSEVERIIKGHSIVMEKTDTHFVMYRSKDTIPGYYTGEPLIDSVLARYTRPAQHGAV